MPRRRARIGEHVGQRNLAVTANTYSHVLVDEAEIDYAELIVRPSVPPDDLRAVTAAARGGRRAVVLPSCDL